MPFGQALPQVSPAASDTDSEASSESSASQTIFEVPDEHDDYPGQTPRKRDAKDLSK
jgi:hypothetical protein